MRRKTVYVKNSHKSKNEIICQIELHFIYSEHTHIQQIDIAKSKVEDYEIRINNNIVDITCNNIDNNTILTDFVYFYFLIY